MGHPCAAARRGGAAAARYVGCLGYLHSTRIQRVWCLDCAGQLTPPHAPCATPAAQRQLRHTRLAWGGAALGGLHALHTSGGLPASVAVLCVHKGQASQAAPSLDRIRKIFS
jgi:hypothetical protein